MVLETVFTLYLTGLMTHVGDNANVKDHVVLVDDRGHVPLLLIYDSQKRLKEAIRLQKGDFLAFDGPKGGDAATDATFDDYVLNLKDVLENGDIDDEIKYNQQHDEVVASLVYPEGKLFADQFYTKKAIIKVGGKDSAPRCLAKVVKFNPTPSARPVQLKISNKVNQSQAAIHAPIEIADGDVVILGNFGLDAHHGHHFGNYRHLSKTSTGIGTVTASGDDCELSNRSSIASMAIIDQLFKYLVADQPECTNTDWP